MTSKNLNQQKKKMVLKFKLKKLKIKLKGRQKIFGDSNVRTQLIENVNSRFVFL